MEYKIRAYTYCDIRNGDLLFRSDLYPIDEDTHYILSCALCGVVSDYNCDELNNTPPSRIQPSCLGKVDSVFPANELAGGWISMDDKYFYIHRACNEILEAAPLTRLFSI
jgi:hypothetical protein